MKPKEPGVWSTMGPVAVEGPGLRYLRQSGLSRFEESELRRRSGYHKALGHHLERCGLWWREKKPSGMDNAYDAAVRWMQRAELDLAEETRHEREERRQRAFQGRIDAARQYMAIQAKAERDVLRERRRRKRIAQQRADDTWNAKVFGPQ